MSFQGRFAELPYGDFDHHDDGSLDHSYPLELIATIRRLPIRRDEVIHFVDFDDTMLPAQRRFAINPRLRDYRGERAYSIISEDHGTADDPTGYQAFVGLLDPANYLLEGYKDFYNPKDPRYVVLTAGDIYLQTLKIQATFGESTPMIVVKTAPEKIRAILEYIAQLGYIPGKITFTDDKIGDFAGTEIQLSEILKNIQVEFFRAIPDTKTNTVRREVSASTETAQLITRLKARKIMYPV